MIPELASLTNRQPEWTRHVSTWSVPVLGRQVRLRHFQTMADWYCADEILTGQSYPIIVDPDIWPIRKIIDVGANVGLAAIWFALHYPQARVMACEPAPHTYELLKQNTKPYPNIVPCELGWWTETGEFEMHYGAVSSAEDTMFPDRGSREATFEAWMIDVAEAIQLHNPRPDILKMDVEGAELAILERIHQIGALAEIPIIYYEFHAESTRDAVDRLLASSHQLAYQNILPEKDRGEMCYISTECLTVLMKHGYSHGPRATKKRTD